MEYRILGPLEVVRDSTSLSLGGERQRALLALLLIHANRVVSIDRIVDSLWSVEPPDTAGNVIQVYVSRLRKLLDPDRPAGSESSVLLTRRPGYLLRVDDGQLDADVFTRMSEGGRRALEDGAPGVAAAALRRSLDVWRGDALADLAFEDFAAPIATKLNEARITTREQLIEARLAVGEHDELIAELEELVDQHPLREGLWAQLMLALYRSGRQAEALRTFRRAADTLLEQLGLDPSPKLRELESRILAQDPDLDPPDATGATAAAPLIGRERQLAALRDAAGMAARGRKVVVQIVAEEGTGMSRLLDEAARFARIEGLAVQRAVAYPTTGAEPGEVAGQLHPEGDVPWSVFISDAQWMDPTSMGLLRRWLVDDDRPMLVVLGHRPLSGRAARPINGLMEAAVTIGMAVSLTVDRVTRADLERVAGPELAAWIYERTAGEPYALGRLLDHLHDRRVISWQSGSIERIGELAEETVAGGPETVAALGKQPRLVVEAVAVAGHPVPFDVVCELVGLDTQDALDLVDDLVAEGLLEESSAGLTLGPSLQSGRLTSTFGATRTRTIAGALVSAWQECGHGDAVDPIIGRLAALAGDDRVAARLLARAGLRAATRHYLGEAQPLLEGAIAAMKNLGETSGRRWGRLHLALAQCHRLGGWPSAARAALDEANYHTKGPDRVDARGWSAQIASDRQDPVTAEWNVAVGEWEAVRLGEPAKYGSLLSLRARILNRLAFPMEADLSVDKAEALLAEFGGERQRYLAAYNRAWIDFDRGCAESAEARFARLLAQVQDPADARRADLLAWWSRSLYRTGRVDEAIQATSEARAAGSRDGDIGPVFLSRMADAEGALLYGAFETALVSAEEMLGLVLQQLPAWENAARMLIARAHVGTGDLERARYEAANAVELCPPTAGGRRWLLACRATSIAVDVAHGLGVDRSARAVVDELTAAQWNEAAIELLLTIGAANKDLPALREALQRSCSLGLASAAARAASLLDEPSGSADTAARMADRAYGSLPTEWREGFAGMAPRIDLGQPKR
ncbi:MAG: winged helix-turn-helix domain-containing protein [Acidimicrobiia bacterium]|nr:winged helix-turn-helix domain-containing protein [Acidimicrobiia bacterium]